MRLNEELVAREVRDAAALLMAQGYEGTHAEELARAFRVSVGQLYRLHRDKRALARWVRATAQRLCLLQLMYDWPYLEEASPDFGRDFVALWRRLATFAREEAALFGVAFLFVPPHEDPPPPRSELEQDLRKLLEVAAQKGLVRPLPSQVLLAIAWGPLAELARVAHLSGAQPEDAEIDALAAAVWEALRAKSEL
jgi:AcrR family transcriptional regulator